MEIEKRYRTYAIASGIDLGIEKRYRTFRYNPLGRNRTLTRTPGTVDEKFPIHMVLQYSKCCNHDQYRAQQWIFCWNLLQELQWPLGKLSLLQITSNWPWTLQLTWLGYVLERSIFRSMDCRCEKRGFPFKKVKFDIQKAMKVNFKVKIKVTIEFLVEKYFRNCTDPQWLKISKTWTKIEVVVWCE